MLTVLGITRLVDEAFTAYRIRDRRAELLKTLQPYAMEIPQIQMGIRIKTDGGYRPANLVISSTGILTGYSSAPSVVTAQPATAG